MNTSGWIIMCLSVGVTTSMFAWTIYKVLSKKDTSHIHSFLEAEPEEDGNEGLLAKFQDARSNR